MCINRDSVYSRAVHGIDDSVSLKSTFVNISKVWNGFELAIDYIYSTIDWVSEASPTYI